MVNVTSADRSPLIKTITIHLVCRPLEVVSEHGSFVSYHPLFRGKLLMQKSIQGQVNIGYQSFIDVLFIH